MEIMEEESQSTAIDISSMDTRKAFRDNMSIEISPSRCCTIDTEDEVDDDDDDDESLEVPISGQQKKERKSVLDRLTIVSVETASTKKKKKKGRRKHAPRNHKPLPEDVLLRRGHSDSISNIPDSFSNTFSKDEEYDTRILTNDQVPALFTFAMVPSFSEDASNEEDNDTTDANIGEEDDLSGIFDEFEDSDEKCVKDVQDKYSSSKYTTDTNMETLAALSKLELNTRTRTESTAFLSEASNDMSTSPIEKEIVAISEPTTIPDQVIDDEKSLVPRNDLELEASRCISLNMFSMFE